MERKMRLLVLLASAAGIALGLVYLARVKGWRDEISRAGEKVQVVVAARALGIGDSLDGGSLAVKDWPKAALPNRTVLAADLDLVGGRSLIHPLPAGEPVMWTDLPEGPRLKVPTEHIPPGFRAVALPADEIRSLSHLLQPGDRVDVAWTSQGDSSGRLKTLVLGESVQVLAVGGRLGGEGFQGDGEEGVNSITLLVRPELALALCQAIQGGEIFLLARNREDRASAPARSLSSPAEAMAAGGR